MSRKLDINPCHDLRVPAKWWQPGHQDCDLEKSEESEDLLLMLQIWHLIRKLSFSHYWQELYTCWGGAGYVWMEFTILQIWGMILFIDHHLQ